MALTHFVSQTIIGYYTWQAAPPVFSEATFLPKLANEKADWEFVPIGKSVYSFL
jgi:hypothetical protein